MELYSGLYMGCYSFMGARYMSFILGLDLLGYMGYYLGYKSLLFGLFGI